MLGKTLQVRDTARARDDGEEPGPRLLVMRLQQGSTKAGGDALSNNM